MEDRLSAELAPQRVEFINFAVGAFHPRQALAMLAKRAIEYEPDLVLFCTTRLSLPLLPGPFRVVRDESNHHAHRATHPFFKSFLVEFAKLRLDPESVEVPAPAVRNEGRESILSALGDFRRRTRIPLVVVHLEYDAERHFDGERELARAIRQRGLHFADMRPWFQGIHPHDLWIYDLDPHPNRRAHAIFADALTDFLRENALLDRRGR
jgi:hypothetical protein